MGTGVQGYRGKYRGTGAQEYRNTGTQETGITEIQEYRNTGI